MKRKMRDKRLGQICGATGALFLMLGASSGSHKYYVDKYSDVNMPLSLAIGTVRTPEFSMGSEWYDILIQVEKPLPLDQMECMLGVTLGPLDESGCSTDDPLLRADWAVWDGGRIVDKGSIPNRCACKFEDKYIYKLLGRFSEEAGKKYVVEVKFTKDGTRLNLAHPHLIVIQHKHMW
jgi:hypothetical protein